MLVTDFNSGVFEYNTNIESIIMPSRITALSSSLFCGCTNLKNVDAPGVINVYANAFTGCTNLSSLNTDQIQLVGEYAFMGCKNLKTINANTNRFDVRKYGFAGSGLGGSVYLRPRLSGAEVGEHAFEGTNISYVYANVETIGESAFANCKKLKTFEYGITSKIQAHAFEGSGLTSLSIGNHLTIGEYAFACCKSLKEIDINQYFNSNFGLVEANAFAGCSGLTKTTLRSNYPYTIQPGAFTGCTGTLYLTSNISQYGTGKESPFSGSNFTEVFIQGYCKEVPARLLYDMPYLYGVDISNTVTSIEAPLATNCPNFDTYYTFETGGTYYAINGYLTSGTTDNRKLVDVPSGKKSILLSNSITSINQAALTNVYSAVIDARSLKNIPTVDGKALVANKLLVAPGMKQKMLTYAEEHPFPDTIIQNQNMYATCDIVETAPAPLADVNCDTKVNAADVVAIYNYIINGN